jgi:hypothetical protein
MLALAQVVGPSPEAVAVELSVMARCTARVRADAELPGRRSRRFLSGSVGRFVEQCRVESSGARCGPEADVGGELLDDRSNDFVE